MIFYKIIDAGRTIDYIIIRKQKVVNKTER